MSLHLELHTRPEIPLEAEVISLPTLGGLSASNVAHLPVYHGNQKAALGDFFRVTGSSDGEIHVQGDLGLVKFIGAGMKSGRLHVEGNVGMHLGAGMSGGEIQVDGSAGDWVGPEMSGGRIVIKGSAGHMVGSAVRGSSIGIVGGEIIVHGDAGNEVGSAMRRGMITIGGNCGDYAGVNMRAGTVIVLGALGIRAGAGMKRGTIVSMHDAEILPTFSFACTYSPVFLRPYLRQIQPLGLAVEDKHLHGRYRRWCGDSIELNRGEILLLEGGS